MSKADSKYMRPASLVHYSEEVAKKARQKYSFEFTIHGAAYRVWFDPKTEKTYFNCGEEQTEALVWLSENIDKLMLVINLNDHIDIVDLHKFVCKHLQASIETLQELKRAPISEQRYLDGGEDMPEAVEKFLPGCSAPRSPIGSIIECRPNGDSI
jgi:hypothetical protein